MIDNPDNTERLIVIVPVGLSRYQRYAVGALNRLEAEAEMTEREPTLGELMFADRYVVARCPACGHESRMNALYVPAPAMMTVSRCGQHLLCPACGAKGLLTRPEADAEPSCP